MTLTGNHMSIVIPVFNEKDNLRPLLEELESALKFRLNFEIIVVDDGSTDGTNDELTILSREFASLLICTHSINRGQSAAVLTGVSAANARVVAIIDGDGQNDPADLPAMYEILIAGQGHRMVAGERTCREDSLLKRLSSRTANAVRRALLHDGIRDTGCGLKVFFKDDFLRIPPFDHMHRFLPALFQRDGGHVHSVPVNHRPRLFGRSKYGVHNRLWVGIVDLLGVMWLRKRKI